MTVSTPYCLQGNGVAPKKRYSSEQAARRDLARKHRWRSRRFPRTYHCPGCGGFHLTAAER